MKKCPNCGEDLQDKDVFCTYCGEKVESETAPTPVTIEPAAEEQLADSTVEAEVAKAVEPVVEQIAEAVSAEAAEAVRAAEEPNPAGAPTESVVYARYTVEENKKKSFVPVFVIGGILLLAVIVVGIFSFGKNLLSGGLNLSAEEKFLNYQYEYFEGKLKSLEELGFLHTEDKQEASLVLTGEVEGQDEINQYLQDSSLTLETKTDLDKGSLQMNMGLTLMGSEILEAYGEYVDGKIGFSIPTVDENFYKGDYKKIMETLTGEELDGTPDLKQYKENKKSLEKLRKKYGTLLSTLITKDNLTVEKTKFTLYSVKK